MIATASACPLGRNATGKTSCSSRPRTYSASWGPGTFVTRRLNSRVEKFSREAWARIVGGAKACTLVSTSAPTACLESFSPCIAREIVTRRATGSSM